MNPVSLDRLIDAFHQQDYTIKNSKFMMLVGAKKVEVDIPKLVVEVLSKGNAAEKKKVENLMKEITHEIEVDENMVRSKELKSDPDKKQLIKETKEAIKFLKACQKNLEGFVKPIKKRNSFQSLLKMISEAFQSIFSSKSVKDKKAQISYIEMWIEDLRKQAGRSDEAFAVSLNKDLELMEEMLKMPLKSITKEKIDLWDRYVKNLKGKIDEFEKEREIRLEELELNVNSEIKAFKEDKEAAAYVKELEVFAAKVKAEKTEANESLITLEDQWDMIQDKKAQDVKKEVPVNSKKVISPHWMPFIHKGITKLEAQKWLEKNPYLMVIYESPKKELSVFYMDKRELQEKSINLAENQGEVAIVDLLKEGRSLREHQSGQLFTRGDIFAGG